MSKTFLFKNKNTFIDVFAAVGSTIRDGRAKKPRKTI